MARTACVDILFCFGPRCLVNREKSVGQLAKEFLGRRGQSGLFISFYVACLFHSMWVALIAAGTEL